MDIRKDIPQREAYIKHLISQLPDKGAFSERFSYKMQLGAPRLDMLGPDGKLRSIDDLMESMRALKFGPMQPLPPEADAFAVDVPPVDVEDVKRRLEEIREHAAYPVYKALTERGDFGFVKPDGSFCDQMIIRQYYDYNELYKEGSPKRAELGKEALTEKALACPDETDRAVYYELARKGKSFIDSNGEYIPVAQLGVGFFGVSRMVKEFAIHRVTDQATNGKALYKLLADKEGAKTIKISETFAVLPENVLQEFLNEVLAQHHDQRKMYHVMQEVVDLVGKKETYGGGERKDPYGDLDANGFSNGFFGFGGRGAFDKGDNEIKRDQGLRYISNIVGKTNDQQTGEHIELPLAEAVRCAIWNLKAPFQLERPIDPKYKVQGKKTLDEKLAAPLTERQETEADAIKAAMFGPDWRSKFTVSQGGDLPDTPGSGGKGR